MLCPTCNSDNQPGMRFCGMCGSSLAPQARGRERRRVSVVFIDLAGFSSLTQDFDPERLRDLADEILTVIAGVVEEYDGFVDSFRGDGLIALFGAPRSHPDDPQRAVLAAAAGLKAIRTIGASRGFPLSGRAGVNTGVVIAGSVGSGRVRDYTVMGSAVNLAARLEEAATIGEVWVGPETFEATRHVFHYTPTQTLTLRGFPDVAQAYRYIPEDEARQRDPYGSLAFVGRTSELAELWRNYRDVVDRSSPRRLWLVGEAGLGKSRLLEEFAAQVKAGEDATIVWYRDQAGPDNERSKFMPLALQLFPITLGEDQQVARNKIEEALSKLAPGDAGLSRTILGSLHFIERRARPRLDESVGKHKRRPQTHVAEAWSRLLLETARRQGKANGAIVMLIDSRSPDHDLALLCDQLLQSGRPVLLVQTRRHVEASDDDTLMLSPLDVDESLALLEQLANPLLEVATRSLVNQVGGIPAYILELGRALSITPTGSFSGSLASLLQARLDMLDPGARQLLAHAAVTGERCWSGLLEQLADGSASELASILVNENLLIEANASVVAGASEYRFQSELLRNAVLRMVPFSDRPALHQRIATWLEEHGPFELSALIGYHFEQAGSPEAAYPHYLAAADTAAARGQYREARELFEHLLCLPLPPELLAQGSLAYAQAALTKSDGAVAREQLVAADQWLIRCDEESAEAFRRVHSQLCREVEALV